MKLTLKQWFELYDRDFLSEEGKEFLINLLRVTDKEDIELLNKQEDAKRNYSLESDTSRGKQNICKDKDTSSVTEVQDTHVSKINNLMDKDYKGKSEQGITQFGYGGKE